MPDASPGDGPASGRDFLVNSHRTPVSASAALIHSFLLLYQNRPDYATETAGRFPGGAARRRGERTPLQAGLFCGMSAGLKTSAILKLCFFRVYAILRAYLFTYRKRARLRKFLEKREKGRLQCRILFMKKK